LIASGTWKRFVVKPKLKKYRKGEFLHLYPKAYEKWVKLISHYETPNFPKPY